MKKIKKHNSNTGLKSGNNQEVIKNFIHTVKGYPIKGPKTWNKSTPKLKARCDMFERATVHF